MSETPALAAVESCDNLALVPRHGIRWFRANMRCARVILLTASIAVSAARAQTKPDFSGEWTLNRAECSLSPAAAGMQSGTLQVEHREPTFRYKATFLANGNPIEYAYELSTDGREAVGTQQGRRTVSSLHWDGDALVFVAKVDGPDPDRTISIQFRYEIVDGRRLRAAEQLRGGGRDQDNIWIYDRR
jgi:hypothetical protein